MILHNLKKCSLCDLRTINNAIFELILQALLLRNIKHSLSSHQLRKFPFPSSWKQCIPHLHSAFCQHCTPWKNAMNKHKAKQKCKLEAVGLHVSKATTETTKKVLIPVCICQHSNQFHIKVSCGQSQGLWEDPFCKNFWKRLKKNKPSLLIVAFSSASSLSVHLVGHRCTSFLLLPLVKCPEKSVNT